MSCVYTQNYSHKVKYTQLCVCVYTSIHCVYSCTHTQRAVHVHMYTARGCRRKLNFVLCVYMYTHSCTKYLVVRVAKFCICWCLIGDWRRGQYTRSSFHNNSLNLHVRMCVYQASVIKFSTSTVNPGRVHQWLL